MINLVQKLICDKKVLILGFGREGKSTLPVLQQAGTAASITVADQNPVVDLPPEVASVTGEGYLGCLNAFDVVFKSPGIVLDKEIGDYQCEIVSQMEIFFRRFRNQIIGVTGTKGKSTTTTMLYHILKESGRKVLLAGNIGIPVFDILSEVEEDTAIVLELSCHQLEYISVSPKRALLLNIYEEHLDHYKTMDRYITAKNNIYQFQKAGDTLYCLDLLAPSKLQADCVKLVHRMQSTEGAAESKNSTQQCTLEKSMANDVNHYVISYKGNDFEIPVEEISLIGEHNYFDIAFVYAVCKDFGMSDEAFGAGLKSYVPLPHRLQFVGKEKGIKWYDDSISTIDETTIQALQTLPDADTVLIGGLDRGIAYDALEQYLSTSSVKNIILMEASGKRIAQEIQANMPDFAQKERIHLTAHLEEAVQLAAELTRAGHSCVLSPAAASYGIFKNFEERGEAFVQYVRQLGE